MTVNRKFKHKVRARMRLTGQNYTAARRDILAEQAEAKRLNPPPEENKTNA